MTGGAPDLLAVRMDRLPMSKGLWRLVGLISLGGAFEFYDLFITAYIAPGLVGEGLFTARASSFFAVNGIGFLVFSTFAGMWLGTLGFGYIADRFGRRTIFAGSLLWYCLATAAMALQHSAVGIDLWRFIAAIGVALQQVTIDTLLSELVPPGTRGRAFAFCEVIQFAAVPVVALLSWLLVPLHPFGLAGWRWVALIGAGGALFAWWFQRRVPESPRWLAQHGKVPQADAILRRLERDAGLADAPPLASSPVLAREASGSLAELFRPPYGCRTLVMSVFHLAQTVGFYGFGSWVPSLLIAKGIRVTTSLEYAFIIALANPLGPLLCWWLADRMERKWQIVCAGALVGIFMLLFAWQTAAAAIILFGVLVTLANNWMSFAFHNYQAELFPTRIRARAIGFVYSWSRVSAACAGLLIGFFLREGGTGGVALFIAAAMATLMIIVGAFGPPTLNRSLEDISH
jgi:putative MFS transporter